MDVLLQARDLRLPPRLDGLSLRLRRGETVGLLGVNGAGKSSLLAALAGVLPGVRGQVRVADAPMGRAARRRIGWLPQRPPLYPELTVEENLRFFAGLRGDADRRRQDALLERFELTALRRRLAGRLSGGERMRLGLACVLAHRPDILLLDEPTAGLDPLQAERLRAHIGEIAGERAVLIASHLLPDIERLCDRALLLHRGRIVAEQALDGDDRVLARFARPPAEAELLALPGIAAAQAQDDGALWLTLTREAPPDLAEQVAARGWGLREWRREGPDLLARFRELSLGEAA